MIGGDPLELPGVAHAHTSSGMIEHIRMDGRMQVIAGGFVGCVFCFFDHDVLVKMFDRGYHQKPAFKSSPSPILSRVLLRAHWCLLPITPTT